MPKSNKKIRNATECKSGNLTFKSQLEKSIYNTLAEQGFNPQYTEGEYKMKDTTMIVSRGLGNSIIPVRLFNYPEIVCVELKQA